MSITIHHGPPGSYKTSGAIQNDLVPAVIQGRTIITNIRGMDDVKKFRKHIKNIPDSFNIINIDTRKSEGRFKMATWFHWAPKDSFIFIDEINTIYPKTMRESDLKEFDYPGGIDQAEKDDRLPNAQEAFEMHRHYNYDICVTTPHINKVHQIVLASAEGALRHKNQAMIGLKGLYQEIFHASDDNGKSKANHLQMRQRRVKRYVFKLYKSTTTDKTRDTQAGRNIFFSPQVLGFIGLVSLLGIYLFFSDAPTAFTGVKNVEVVEQVNSPSDQVVSNTAITGNTDTIPVVVPDVVPDYLAAYDVYFVGNIKVNSVDHYQLQLVQNKHSLTISNDWLASLGYELTLIGDCLAELKIGKIARLITCPLASPSQFKPDSPADTFTAQDTLPI